MTPGEPQSAVDYDDRTTAAVQTVLIEIGQILGSFKGKFAIVGGAVPWLLLGKTDDMPHVGTMDVDLGLDAEACRPLLDHPSGAIGFDCIARKFDSVEGFGPTCVRRFVEDTDVLRDRTPEQWQQDAFGQVDAWLRTLGLRS
ncbi:hypothetical protein OJJOAM_004078 [Cupriavidus sp. H18C1]|uniref:hypothetical protein n=1 Tax=Cupriavidus sp. H18C1 TaxID=3241601 RepID=UPI003BB92C95